MIKEMELKGLFYWLFILLLSILLMILYFQVKENTNLKVELEIYKVESELTLEHLEDYYALLLEHSELETELELSNSINKINTLNNKLDVYEKLISYLVEFTNTNAEDFMLWLLNNHSEWYYKNYDYLWG